MRRLALVPLILGAAVTGAAWLGTPRVERAMTFFPTRTAAGVPAQKPSNARELWFDTRDGVRLHAWLLWRDSGSVARGPLLYSHGNTGNLEGFLPAAERLRSAGFDVMVWDYRGYGRSGGVPRDEAALYVDAEAALSALMRETSAPARRIVHYGYSLGTAVATELAVRHGCRVLALESPFSSALDQALSHVPILPMLMWPFANNRFLTERKIAGLGCPLLVIHGDADEIIPLTQGMSVYAAAPMPKKLFIVPGGRHWMGPQTSWSHLDELPRFIDQRRID